MPARLTDLSARKERCVLGSVMYRPMTDAAMSHIN